MFAALVIVLAQYGALVHATDHPFHHEEALCIMLQSVEQDKHFFHAGTFSQFDDVIVSDVLAFLSEEVTASLYPNYFSRAPPVTILYI